MRTREVSHKDETIKSLSCRTNNNRPYGLKAPSLCLPVAGIRAARGSTAEQHQNTEDEQAAWLSTEDLGLAEEDKLHSTRWREPRLAALVWNWAVQTPRSFLHALPAYLNSGPPPVNLSPEQAEPNPDQQTGRILEIRYTHKKRGVLQWLNPFMIQPSFGWFVYNSLSTTLHNNFLQVTERNNFPQIPERKTKGTHYYYEIMLLGLWSTGFPVCLCASQVPKVRSNAHCQLKGEGCE